jgi:hypothetical protein
MPKPGHTTLVAWDIADGEVISHRGQNFVPVRDYSHPLWKHRSLFDVPNHLVAEILRDTPGVSLLEPEPPSAPKHGRHHPV